MSAEKTGLVTISREQCLELLAEHSFGRLAVNLGEGAPVIRPVNYAFDRSSQCVVFRTDTGSKLHAVLHSAHAAFEIDGMDPESRTGWSVIIVGITEEVTRAADLARLQRLNLETWAPGHKSHWVQIRARTVSGRRIIPSEAGSHAG